MISYELMCLPIGRSKTVFNTLTLTDATAPPAAIIEPEEWKDMMQQVFKQKEQIAGIREQPCTYAKNL